MSKNLLGIFCGIVFGILDVAIMIPLPMKDQRVAMNGAFINRFAIGLVLGAGEM